MVELGQHIEWLLQDNDCVIVPGLGGFITHYSPAKRVNKENRFLPPMRIIGFNPMLKLNDGLLVQSFMAVYGINFCEASQKVSAAVNKLLIQLHENGKVKIGSIGELHLSIYGIYSFIPYDRQLSSPHLYGLTDFKISELKELKQIVTSPIISLNPTLPQKRRYRFKFKMSYLANTAAIVAIIALFFFLPTPLENTEIIGENYAQLLPNDIFEKLEKQSLAITPIIVKNSHKKDEQVNCNVQTIQQNTSLKKRTAIPITVKEVKVAQQTSSETIPNQKEKDYHINEIQSEKRIIAPASKHYHIIVASVSTEKDAKAMAEQLIAQGHTEAKAIIGNGKMRVCIESYATESEAYLHVNELRKNEKYHQAWVLKQ